MVHSFFIISFQFSLFGTFGSQNSIGSLFEFWVEIFETRLELKLQFCYDFIICFDSFSIEKSFILNN